MEMVLAHPEMILLKQTSASTVVPVVFGCFPVMIHPPCKDPQWEYGTFVSGIWVPAGSSNLYQLDPLQSGLVKIVFSKFLDAGIQDVSTSISIEV